MGDLPKLVTMDPVELTHRLSDSFGAVGVTSPGGKLFVGLAWLYLEATRYMETLRMATQEMTDEEGLMTVVARLQDNVDSVAHYATAVSPEIADIEV